MSTNDEHRIDKLKNELYSQEGVKHAHREGRFHQKQYNVGEKWRFDENVMNEGKPESKGNFFVKLLTFSFLFFIVAGIIAAYIFLRGGSVVSANNITISVAGPLSTEAGAELSLDVGIVNQNPVDLQVTDLVVRYPQGTRQSVDSTSQLPEERISLGTLKSGELVKQSISPVLFGQEGEVKDINLSIEYRLAGSNAVFHSDKVYKVTIASSPVSLKITSLKEINSGQDITLDAVITSNSSNIIKGLLFKVDYPFGFKFKSSVPATDANTNQWIIGDLAPKATKEIKITGTMVGTENDDRVFRFYTGTQDPTNPSMMSIVFVDTTQAVAIRKPFLGIDLAFNGSTNDPFVTTSRGSVRGILTYTNNLSVPINNAEIILSIKGATLDKTSVNTSSGFYQSLTNTITWNKEQKNDLAEIKPGAKGTVEFNFSPVDLSGAAGSSYTRPTLDFTINVAGNRYSDKDVPETITSTLSRTVQIASNLTVQGISTYSIGAFTNSGPIPPEPEKPTTYTVALSVANSLNDVQNAFLVAKIPQYITWLNIFSPTNADVQYNSATRELRWNIGSVKAGAGYNSIDAKKLSLQLSITPSVSQGGTTPELLSGIRIEGDDSFTGSHVVLNAASVSTILSGSDPKSSSENARVVKK